jgi:hypothetical protein
LRAEELFDLAVDERIRAVRLAREIVDSQAHDAYDEKQILARQLLWAVKSLVFIDLEDSTDAAIPNREN